MARIYEPNGYQIVNLIKTGKTPRAVAVTPDGKIYVANYLTVSCYKLSGNMDHPVLAHPDPDGSFDHPMALSVGDTGEIYVGYSNGLVAILDKDGKPKGNGFMAVEDEIRGVAVK
jgi:DNA-binding beta-propeller fold protein YncE